MSAPIPGGRRGEAGLSYVEVLIATAVLALALVPALDALEIGLLGGAVHEELAVRHLRLAGKLEEVLAQPFSDLEVEAIVTGGSPSALWSDPVGAPDRRVVTLSTWDADGSPGPDPGIVHVRVEIEGTAHVLETLASL